MTRFGTLIFLLAILFGPIYTVQEYHYVLHTISELGAQNTPNNLIMIAGFVSVGASLVVDGIRAYSHSRLPFILFGVFIALAGLFPHKPLDESVGYQMWIHTSHQVLATVAGFAVTIGFIWQGVLQKASGKKLICYYLALVCTLFPAGMLYLSEYQGLIQRAMYAQVFLWLWLYYPRLLPARK